MQLAFLPVFSTLVFSRGYITRMKEQVGSGEEQRLVDLWIGKRLVDLYMPLNRYPISAIRKLIKDKTVKWQYCCFNINVGLGGC